MKVIITGATGTVGSEVVRQAIADDSIDEVILLARRTSSIKHPKVTEVIHHNFVDYSGLETVFARADACVWCLGISQTRVSKDEYFSITYEYAVAAAKAMLNANPAITYLFLSGEGADTTGKSKVRFAKVKGKTENALMNMPFKKLIIFRPGGIYPVVRSTKETLFKKGEIGFIKVMKFFAPFSVVNTDVLAKAMLKSLVHSMGKVLVRHKDIRAL